MRSKTDILAEEIWKEYVYCGMLRQSQPLPSIRSLHNRFGGSHSQILQALLTLCELGITEKRSDGSCILCNTDIPFRSFSEYKVGIVVVDTIPNSFCMRLLEGVRRRCDEYGCMLLISTSNADYDKEIDCLQQLLNARCAGIIMLPTVRTREQILDDHLSTQNHSYPIVLVDQTYPHQHRPQLVFDNEQAGYDMTSLLLAAGHRRIGFMDANLADRRTVYRSVKERHVGYVKALRKAGITPDTNWCWTGVNWTHPSVLNLHLRAILKRWAKADPSTRPTAVLAVEDYSARLTIDILKEMGLEGQITVTGFDNLMQYQTSGKPFPTTNPNLVRAGEMAADMLFKHIDGLLPQHTTMVLPVPIMPGYLQGYIASSNDGTPADAHMAGFGNSYG